ncbi:MAG: hypothetical protein JO020_30950 [Chloroflexi bacterium]|nr:hypothetical protein [Chloroflexota bacterium]
MLSSGSDACCGGGFGAVAVAADVDDMVMANFEHLIDGVLAREATLHRSLHV